MAKKKTQRKVTKTKATGTELVDLTPEEIRKLPKARPGFEAFVASLLGLYRSEGELAIKGFDPGPVQSSFSAYQALKQLEESAVKHLEMVQETRLLHSSNAWSGLLTIYMRARSVAKTNPDVARGIADFAKFMQNGPRKKKAVVPASE